MIRPANASDAAAIADLYNHYIVSSTITFEETPVSVDEMAQRIQNVSEKLPWLVCVLDEQILGYAYATPWRVRSAYRYSVESTVYVSPSHPRQGIGTKLYEALIDALRMREIKVVLGVIALPNVASVALHERFGFEKVAHLKRVGLKFDTWIDVGYWENMLA